MTAPITPRPDPEPCGCGDEERRGFDAGGLLKGGKLIIPASTMQPLPELTPEQQARHNQLIMMAQRMLRTDES